MKTKNVGLFLMGKKGLTSLHALAASGSIEKVAFIVAGQDNSIKEDYFEDIKRVSESYNIDFTDRTQIDFTLLKCNHAIAIGWRWMIPLDFFPLIVFHDSLLPKLRGFNPLVTALIEGYSEIGVTALLAGAEFDKGPVLGQSKARISYPVKINEAIDIVSALYAGLLNEVIDSIQRDNLQSTDQDETEATYSLWRNDEDYLIDWSQDASRICRFVDAVGFPYLGAFTNYDGQPIRIVEAAEIDDLIIVNRTPGKILKIDNNQPLVVCGSGLVRIKNATYGDGDKSVVFNKLRVKLK
jgi:methionyl-tRNA formyltransferase